MIDQLSDQQKSVMLATAMGNEFDDEERCPVCGWSYDVSDFPAGCIPGNCSQRPAHDDMSDLPLFGGAR